MKNTIKVLGVIALLAIIGFSMAACDDGGGGGGPGTITLSGSYYMGNDYISFSSKDNKFTAFKRSYGYQYGTYTRTGNNIYLDYSLFGDDQLGRSFTIVDSNTIRSSKGYTFKKK